MADNIDAGVEPVAPDARSRPTLVAKTTPAQIVLCLLGAVAFLYFARPVLLPVILACVAGMTLKPLVSWLARYRVPSSLAAAMVLSLLMTAHGVGFFHLGRPAAAWVNDAPST